MHARDRLTMQLCNSALLLKEVAAFAGADQVLDGREGLAVLLEALSREGVSEQDRKEVLSGSPAVILSPSLTAPTPAGVPEARER